MTESVQLTFSIALLEYLMIQGVSEIVFCPGSFNSPLIKAASLSPGIQQHFFYDERSASFFALGRVKQSRLPVVVCVTSGTAVSECLSAMIEAQYTGLPLVLLSADRATRFVGTGSPQVIDQVSLTESITQKRFDLDATTVLPKFKISSQEPSHINVRFEEPLFGALSKSSEDHALSTYDFSSFQSPLVILGELQQAEALRVEKFLSVYNGPILCEPLSQLRNSSILKPQFLRSYDLLLSHFTFDAVIRVGGVPVTSYWRELERNPKLNSIPVVSLSHLPFKGLARSSLLLSFSELARLKQLHFDEDYAKFIFSMDAQATDAQSMLLQEYPCSEPAWFHRLSLLAAKDKTTEGYSALYLGNSLVIREWGEYASSENFMTVHAHRGANGIDGQVASYAGIASGQKTIGVIGDLTFLYDVTSLSHIPRNQSTLFVINNSGGKIFERLSYFATQFKDEQARNFINPQQVNLSLLCKAYDLSYGCWQDGEQPQGAQIIEIKVDNEQTEQFNISKADLYNRLVKDVYVEESTRL